MSKKNNGLFAPFVMTMLLSIAFVNLQVVVLTSRTCALISGFIIALIGWMGYVTGGEK